MTNTYKTVAAEEFDEFIKSYPRKLNADIVRICEPPCKTYNDFTISKVWNECIVAKVSLGSMCGLEDEYFIKIGGE